MTISEYNKIEENFRNDTVGKSIEYDGNGNFQCWDSAQVYFTKYLNLPETILGGCGVVNNMLYPPKINDLLEYFDEADIFNMTAGDVCIWDWGKDLGHIAIYDHWDGVNCWFVTQNNPTPHVTDLAILDTSNMRAFRLKGIVPDTKTPTDDEILDYLRRIINWDNV